MWSLSDPAPVEMAIEPSGFAGTKEPSPKTMRAIGTEFRDEATATCSAMAGAISPRFWA
jgi:hypothetical protein